MQSVSFDQNLGIYYSRNPLPLVTKGQPAGNWDGNSVVFLPSFERQALPTPESPEENRTETPRAPSWANIVQTCLAYEAGTDWCKGYVSPQFHRTQLENSLLAHLHRTSVKLFEAICYSAVSRVHGGSRGKVRSGRQLE